MSENFDSKPVEEYEERLKREVIDRDLKDTTYLDLARIDAYEAKRLRERTAEEIENFDINQPGLAVHGTFPRSLESIIKNGLGRRSDKNEGDDVHDLEVDLHVIGGKTFTIDTRKETQAGFGPDETVFNKEDETYRAPLYLVSDIFKNLYPEVIEEVLKGTSGRPMTSNYEHIAIAPKGERPNSAYGKRGELPYEDIPRGFVVFPSGNTSFFVEFPKENDEAELLARKLLAFQSFNGIVIPEECKILGFTIKQADTLKKVIKMQNKLLPKEEQAPCYSTDGKCIYNPLEK